MSGLIGRVLRDLGRRIGGGKTARPARIDHRNEKSNVALVLVHGFSGNLSATWANFANILLEEPALKGWDLFGVGYPSSLRVDVPKVWAADPDITILSSSLRTTLSLPPFNGYRCLAIAAHSMGGLVVQRAIVDDRTLIAQVSHLFLFGTPSNGLLKARMFSRLKRQVRDMAANGRFINTLRRDWAERFPSALPFSFRAIAGDRDEFVPALSSIVPFPDDVRAVVPGNHLEIVRPEDRNHPSVALIVDALTGGPNVRQCVDSGRLAVEMKDFHAAVQLMLPSVATLDDAALASLALALEGLGRRHEALQILESHFQRGQTRSTDAIGVLAGRLKRRWLVERAVEDLTRSKGLYTEGLERAESEADHAQAYYHAINIAFLELLSLPPNSDVSLPTIKMAERARHHCALARESHWSLATEGEAYLMLGFLDRAENLYSRAVAKATSARDINSMYSQAIRVAVRVFGENGAARIERLFNLQR